MVQTVPLLFVHDAVGALYAAVLFGLMGALGQSALVDLVIRSAPRGCQGSTMMLFFGCYFFSVRTGDLLGTWIYDKHGGFIPTVIVTIIADRLRSDPAGPVAGSQATHRDQGWRGNQGGWRTSTGYDLAHEPQSLKNPLNTERC